MEFDIGPIIECRSLSGPHIVIRSDGIQATDGETTTRLTEGDWTDQYAFWSRGGKYIYFNSDRAGATNIHRMLMDGVECVRDDV